MQCQNACSCQCAHPDKSTPAMQFVFALQSCVFALCTHVTILCDAVCLIRKQTNNFRCDNVRHVCACARNDRMFRQTAPVFVSLSCLGTATWWYSTKNEHYYGLFPLVVNILFDCAALNRSDTRQVLHPTGSCCCFPVASHGTWGACGITHADY